VRAQIAHAQKLAAAEPAPRTVAAVGSGSAVVAQVAQTRTYSNAAEPSRSH